MAIIDDPSTWRKLDKPRQRAVKLLVVTMEFECPDDPKELEWLRSFGAAVKEAAMMDGRASVRTIEVSESFKEGWR